MCPPMAKYVQQRMERGMKCHLMNVSDNSERVFIIMVRDRFGGGLDLEDGVCVDLFVQFPHSLGFSTSKGKKMRRSCSQQASF